MKKCLNCDHPFSSEDKHCRQCGQKTKFNKLRFSSLVKDFFSNLFNLENKIWNSLKDIWIPAKLSLAFIAGKRVIYYHPLRIFLVVLFSFFTLFLMQIRESLSSLREVSSTQEKNIWKEHYLNNYDTLALEHEVLRDSTLNFKAIIFKKKEDIIDDPTENDTTSIAGGFKEGWENYDRKDTLPPEEEVVQDEIENRKEESEVNPNNEFYYDGGSFNATLINEIPAIDLFKLSPDKLKQKYGNGLWYKELFLVQSQKIIKDLQSSVTFFIGNGTWAIILIVLLMSFIFYLLYWRHSIHYAEHFILQVNAHTRLLLLGVIFIIIGKIKPDTIASGWFLGVWFLLSLIYMYKSLRNFYKQSRFKTLIKMCVGLMSYVFILSSCLLFILVLSGVLL